VREPEDPKPIGDEPPRKGPIYAPPDPDQRPKRAPRESPAERG
jgi:hypothetical protein